MHGWWVDDDERKLILRRNLCLKWSIGAGEMWWTMVKSILEASHLLIWKIWRGRRFEEGCLWKMGGRNFSTWSGANDSPTNQTPTRLTKPVDSSFLILFFDYVLHKIMNNYVVTRTLITHPTCWLINNQWIRIINHRHGQTNKTTKQHLPVIMNYF